MADASQVSDRAGLATPCVAPGLDAASRAAAVDALLAASCALDGATRVPIQDHRRRLAGFGSALNVFLTLGLAQLRSGRAFDGAGVKLKSSPSLDYGAGIDPRRCSSSTMACLFTPLRCPPPRTDLRTGGPTSNRTAAFEALWRAHPYALLGAIAEVHWRPNAWLQPQIDAVAQHVGIHDIAVHIRRGDKLTHADQQLHARAQAAPQDGAAPAAAVGPVAPSTSAESGSDARVSPAAARPPPPQHAARAHNRGDTIKLVNESTLAQIIGRAASRLHLRSVLIMSDDDDAPSAVACALPPWLRVEALVQGHRPSATGARRASGGDGNSGGDGGGPGGGMGALSTLPGVHMSTSAGGRLRVHRVDGMELGAFLVAGMWSMARARVIVSNSGSNLGNLIMTLAGVRTASVHTPHLIDLDGALSTQSLFGGTYLCNLAPRTGTPARYGVCGPISKVVESKPPAARSIVPTGAHGRAHTPPDRLATAAGAQNEYSRGCLESVESRQA